MDAMLAAWIRFWAVGRPLPALGATTALPIKARRDGWPLIWINDSSSYSPYPLPSERDAHGVKLRQTNQRQLAQK